jgi:DNA-binding NarL/FixJ family response regulator
MREAMVYAAEADRRSGGRTRRPREGGTAEADLILVDIGRPKLNGIEAAWPIRVLISRATIVFLTKEKTFDFVQKALELGAVGYVHKSDMRDGRAERAPSACTSLTTNRRINYCPLRYPGWRA